MRKYYLVNTMHTDIDYISCSNKQFIEESIKHGLVFTESEFILEFNNVNITTEVHQLRII